MDPHISYWCLVSLAHFNVGIYTLNFQTVFTWCHPPPTALCPKALFPTNHNPFLQSVECQIESLAMAGPSKSFCQKHEWLLFFPPFKPFSKHNKCIYVCLQRYIWKSFELSIKRPFGKGSLKNDFFSIAKEICRKKKETKNVICSMNFSLCVILWWCKNVAKKAS